MRFLCSWQYRDENDQLIKKCEMLNTRTNDIKKGQVQLLSRISTDYNIKSEFIDREEDESQLEGIFYITPKRDNTINELSNIEIDEELEAYEREFEIDDFSDPYS